MLISFLPRRVTSLAGVALAALLLCAGWSGAAEQPAAEKPRQPNILLICLDDLKPTLGCYGDALAVSPNIDRIAAQGIRFDAAYCNQAVCAPSRNSLLTGLRPQTLGIYDLPTNFRKSRPDAITLPEHFKNNGYRAEGLGKIYHIGHGNIGDDRSWSVPIFRGKLTDYALEENKNPQGLTREEARFGNVPELKAGRLPRGAAVEAAEVDDDVYTDGQVAAEAVRRLANAAKHPDEPFFLAVGFLKPHLPFCAPKKYWDLYDPAKFELAKLKTPPEGTPDFAPTTWGELRQYREGPETGPVDDELARRLIHGYYAATSYADAQVGRVLDALEASGLADDTIVIVWGDHGWHLGDHGMWCKHTNYEQAGRIPLIVDLPGDAPAGAKSEELVESVDLYPTLCELAGLDLPYELDGASFVSTLRDPAHKTDAVAFQVYPRNELLGRVVRTDRYRLVEWKTPGAPPADAIIELYDYEADPLESRNLASEQPDVVAELRGILAQQPEAKPQVKGPWPKRAGKGKQKGNQKQRGKKKQPQA